MGGERVALYIEVAVDRPRPAGATAEGDLGLILSYRIPPEMDVRPGHLVLVPLGGRVTQGIAVAITDTPAVAVDKVLELLRLVDPDPVLTADQLELGRWIAGYYRCSLYAALALMLPPGVSSQEVVTLHLVPGGREGAARLTARQAQVLDLLAQGGGVLPADQVRRRMDGGDLNPVVRQLEKRGLVERRSSLVRPRVGPRHELFVRLVAPAADGKA